MKVIDVHPEELLDRELNRTLTEEQRARLDAHLARCEVCRLERMMRADFAAEAARRSQPDMQAFVLGALQQAAVAPAPQQALHSPMPARRTAGARRLSALVIAACLLLGTGAALARTGWAERAWELASSSWRKPQEHEQQDQPTKRAAKRRTDNVVAPTVQPRITHSTTAVEVAALATDVGVEAVPLVVSAGAVSGTERSLGGAQSRRVRASKNLTRRAHGKQSLRATTDAEASMADTVTTTTVRVQPLVSPIATSAPSAITAKQPEVPVEPQQLSAAQLFDQANRARQQARVDQAAQLYRELQNRYASSPEAKLSHALLARMWLDGGDARAASASFQRYLDSGDRALREEAMAGRALALSKQGREREAQEAFGALLQAYPRSSYAALAKRKLGQD